MAVKPLSSARRAAPSFRPTLEPLEDRTVPASLSVSGSRLTIRGDGFDNRVVIGDNGDGDLIVNITGAPGRSGTFQNITRISISTLSGNDRITYIQQGNRTRNMTLAAAPRQRRRFVLCRFSATSTPAGR
jgi:hypothetical protein